MRSRTFRTLISLVAVAMTLVMASSCAVRTTSILRDPNVVRIAVNPWVGYKASAAVLKYILENEMGYQVKLVQLAEQASWQALDQGALDVIVENWGHEDLMKTYGEQLGSVVDGGPNGNIGQIGWYVPTYTMEKYPELKTYKGLYEHWEIFQTAESGDKGQFLAGAPGFVTQDQGMIDHFDLNLEVVYAGSEAAQITEVQQRYADEEPILFYFYKPQWLHNQLDLSRVDFPDPTPGCAEDLEDVSCDYPRDELNKIFRADWAQADGPAYRFIKNWKWTNEDQNAVAELIASKGLPQEQAAQQWVKENPDLWREWLPEGAQG